MDSVDTQDIYNEQEESTDNLSNDAIITEAIDDNDIEVELTSEYEINSADIENMDEGEGEENRGEGGEEGEEEGEEKGEEEGEKDGEEMKEGGTNKRVKRNYMKIPNIVKAGMRLGLPYNTVALLGTAAAVDFDVVTPNNRQFVIDRHKVGF